MKTTVEISDPLLRKVREFAAREGVTLRTLVERGLHHVVSQMERRTPFKVRGRASRATGCIQTFATRHGRCCAI
jgi:hypothetical protein